MATCTCRVRESHALTQSVNEMLALGMSLREIERTAKSKGIPIKAETVGLHLKNCLGGVRPESQPVAIQQVANNRAGSANGGPDREERDLARLVQQKTVERIINGELQPTIKDGLAATALLDKREARNEDRRFMLGLARLLSGAGKEGPVEPGVIIDVTPNPLLAPASVRAED